MAEESLNENLNVLVNLSGEDQASSGIDSLVSRLNQLINDTQKLDRVRSKGTADYSKALKSIDKQYNVLNDNLNKSLQQFKKNFHDLKSGLNDIKTGFIRIISLLTGGAGIQGAIKYTREYDNTLLALSATTRRLGVGMVSLDKHFASLADRISITRQDLSALFKTYQQAFPLESIQGFESILKNIENLTGANTSEMNSYLQTLSGILEKYPDLQKYIENLTDQNREYLKIQADSLYMTRAISKEEYMRLNALANGTKFLTVADRQKLETTKANQKAVQQLSVTYEKIKLSIGKFLLPYVQKFAEWISSDRVQSALKTMMDTFERIAKKIFDMGSSLIHWLGGVELSILKIGGLFAALKLGSYVFSFAKMAFHAGSIAKSVSQFAGTGMLGGGMKGVLGRVGTGAAIGTPLALGGMALSAYGDSQGGYGSPDGVAPKMIGSTLQGAGYGAAIGSILPGIGTVVGGAIGALAGFTVSIFQASAALDKMKENDERTARQNKKQLDITKEAERITTERLRVRQEADRKYNTTDIANKYGRQGQDKFTQQIDTTMKSDRSQISNIDKSLEGYYKKRQRYEEDLKSLQEAQADAVLRKDEDGVKAAGNAISRKQQLIMESDKKNDAALQERYALVAAIGKAEQGIAVATRSRDIQLQAMRDNFSALSSLMEEQLYITQQNIQLGDKELQNVQHRTLQRAKDRQISLDEQIKNVQAQIRQNKQRQEKLKQGDQEKKNAVELRGLETNRLVAEAKLIGFQKERLGLSREVLSIQTAVIDKYDKRLQTMQMETQYYSDLVSLADSFGMGLGASIEARTQVVQLLENQKVLVEEQYNKAVKLRDLEKSKGSDAKNLESLEQKVIEMQQKKLSLLQQQADVTKQMREGWVSAIQAMTTGSGKFTKIAMDANKNMATQMSVLGAVESAMSGSARTGYRMTSSNGGGPMQWSAGGIGSARGQVRTQMAYLNRPGGNNLSEVGLARNLSSYVEGGVSRMKSRGQYFSGSSSPQRLSAIAADGIPKNAMISPSDITTKNRGALYRGTQSVNDIVSHIAGGSTSNSKGKGPVQITINMESSDPSEAARQVVQKLGNYLSRSGDIVYRYISK